VTEKSRLRRSLTKWAGASEHDEHEARHDHDGDTGPMSIAEAPDRALVTVEGTLRTITLRPRGGVPALEAELDDGSAVLTVIWLGRRQIAGISPGRAMRVTGRIGALEGTRTMYNPRYELMP